MQIDHVHFYVDNARKWGDWFVQVMGFQLIASDFNSHTQTEVVSSGGKVIFVLSSPLTSDSPVAQFLRLHPSGIADVALAVTDIETVRQQAIAQGAKILQPLQKWQSSKGRLRWTQIGGITGLNHTLVERTGITPLLPHLPQILPRENSSSSRLNKIYFTGIDHIVLNVAAGDLERTVSWYEAAFGFARKQTFNIQTARSGLFSQVMVHPASGLQFPVNEPNCANSQIQEFLDVNQGSGIQHLALKTRQITEVTRELRTAGVPFLEVPLTYYTQIKEQYPDWQLSAREWQEIKDQQILIDCERQVDLTKLGTRESPPLLLQIFTQPIFEKPTFFFELIERRCQAKGFGEGNFQALFEAIEREQIKRVSLS